MKPKILPVLILLLLAFGLRVSGLANHSIWWDEGVGGWLARMPTQTILHWTAHDVHPPFHYLVLRWWWLLTGDGEFVLRFPSVIAGTLGVLFIYKLGQALGNNRAGLLSAFLLALSRFAITWSQEIRMYGWATMLSAGALWASVALWRKGGWRSWLAYVATVTGSLLTLYLTISVPLITNLGFLWAWLKRRRSWRLLLCWASAQIAAAVLFIPWLIYALPRMPTWSTAETASPAFFTHLYTTLLAVGTSVNLATHTPLTVLTFGTLITGLIALWKMRRSAEQTAGLVMLLSGLLLPALLVYILSLPIQLPYGRRLDPRYFLPLSTCFYMLLGWSLAALAQRSRWAARIGLALVTVAALSGLVTLYPGQARHDDFVSLSATLQAHRHPNDAVIFHTDKGWPVFGTHYAGDWQGIPHAMPLNTEAADGLLQSPWETSEAIWLVLAPDAQQADPDQVIQAWLETLAFHSTTWEFGENRLFLYSRTLQRAERNLDLAPDFVPPTNLQAAFTSEATLLGSHVPLPRYLVGDTLHLFLYWSPPPTEPFIVEIAGPIQQTRSIDPPTPAHSGPTRQQIDLPLTPDLPPGSYQLSLQTPEGQTLSLGAFTLVHHKTVAETSAAEIDSPLGLRLGESILLLGYDLPNTAVEPGDALELTLYWQATEPIPDRYKVFTHLLGETYNASTDNFIWGQQDNEPVNNRVATTTWRPDTIIADPYLIHVAPDAPPGLYTLEIGMYGLADGIRLPIMDGNTPPEDSLILAEIQVSPQ